MLAIGGRILIFGHNRRTYKVNGQTKARKCNQCTHERPFKIVEEKKWFSFFFIPLFPYKKRNLLVCSVCGAGFEAKGEVQSASPSNTSQLKHKETVYQAIKEKFNNGEITENEFIRMINVLNFESSHQQ